MEAPAAPAAHIPTRTCVGCRRRAPRATLMRMAVHAGRVEADPQARTPGRGAWICPDAACLDQALQRGGAPLRRALRVPRAGIDADALRADVAGGVNTNQSSEAAPTAGRGRRQGVST